MDESEEAIAAEREGDWDHAVGIYTDLLARATSDKERARLHLKIGNCLFEDSKADAADDALASAVLLAESCRDSEILGQARLVQGRVELEQGHHKRALDRLTKARELLGDSTDVLLVLCTAKRERGELGEAEELVSELQARTLSSREQAETLDELGAIHLERSDFAAAEAVLREALDLDLELNTAYQTAHTRLQLAQALMGLGESREARQLIDDAADAYEDSDRGLSNVYTVLGQWHEDAGDYLGAAKQYRRARDLDQESEDAVGQARAQRKLARIHRLRGDKDRAQDALEDAERLLTGLDDDLEWAALYMEEGHLCIADTDYDKAIERFNKALAVAEADGEERAIAVAKRGLAMAVWRDGRPEQAATLLREALPVLQARGDLRELNDLYDDLGEVLIDLDEYDQALESLDHSLELDEQLHTTASKARTLLLMGQAHLRRGDRRLAGEHLQQALDVYREADDEEGKATALCVLGNWLSEEGHLDDALDKFKQALRIDSRQEDTVGIARAQRGIAGIYRRRGDFERAEEALRSAEIELKGKEDPMEEALLSLELARLAIDRSEWREAEFEIKAAMRTFDQTRSPVQRAVSDRLMAAVYAADPKSRMKALELLEQAEVVLREKHDFPELDDLYDDLAVLYLLLNRPEEAMTAVGQSLEIGDQMDWNRGNGESLVIRAKINMYLGRMVDAHRDLDDAIDCFEQAGDDVGQSEAHLLLGDWHVANGKLDEAVTIYRAARRIDRWHGDLRGVSRALRKLGEVYLKRHEFSRAEEAFDQAEEYLKGTASVEDRAHLSLARGRLFSAQGNHESAVGEFTSALKDFDTLMLEDEKVRTYKELVSSYHALGEYGLAMESMRKMGLEQAALWGSLLDSFESEIRVATQSAFLRGDYRAAIAGAYSALESALRKRTSGTGGLTERSNASEFIKAWYRVDARGLGTLDDKTLEQLSNLATAAFNLFRNRSLHGGQPLSGVDAFVGISIAQYLHSTLDV
jgi:tetratricopeptide (TPR) repeat protein